MHRPTPTSMRGPVTVDCIGFPFCVTFENPSYSNLASLITGNIINLFLYGVLTVQFYLYYISFPQDPLLLKTIVYLIYLTETGHSFLLIYDFGSHLVLSDVGGTVTVSFSFLDVDGNANISLVVVPVCGAIVAFLTQATYIYRLRILSQSTYISWSILVIIAANFVVFITLALLAAVTDVSPISFNDVAAYTVAFQVWASVSLAIDTTIAGLMIWSLTKNKILSKQLKSKVIRLVYLIIGTGALTVAINLSTLIPFALGSPIALAPTIVLSKLYANSMMVFLNDRILYGHGRDDHATSEMVTGALGSMRLATLPGPADAAQ